MIHIKKLNASSLHCEIYEGKIQRQFKIQSKECKWFIFTLWRLIDPTAHLVWPTEHFSNAECTKLTHDFPHKSVTLLISINNTPLQLTAKDRNLGFILAVSSFFLLPQAHKTVVPRKRASHTSLLHPCYLLLFPVPSHLRSNLIYLKMEVPSLWMDSESWD